MPSLQDQRHNFYGRLTTVNIGLITGQLVGDWVYNTTLGTHQYWNGAAWTTFRDLQDAYNRSGAAPHIVVSVAGGGVTVRDAAVPIAADLFRVENNAAGLLLGVDVNGVEVGVDLNMAENDVLNIDYLYGGTLAASTMNLRGSTHAQLGTINAWSPIDLQDVVTALVNPAYQIRNEQPLSTPAVVAVVHGVVRSNQTETVNTGVWFSSQIVDQSTYITTTPPIFSAFTLFNALPIIANTGFVASVVLTGAVGTQISVTHRNSFATATTTIGDTGLLFRPAVDQALAGGSMTKTGCQGVSVTPIFTSVVGSSAGFTTVYGVQMNNPLFTAHLGTTIFGTYCGVRMENITNKLAGTIVCAVDSALVAGANNYFLRDTGGAQSSFTGNMGFFGNAPVAQQASGANLTNNVAAGGVNDTIANFVDLVVYANDAATIRNDIYQLARKLKQVNDALRLYGLLT